MKKIGAITEAQLKEFEDASSDTEKKQLFKEILSTIALKPSTLQRYGVGNTSISAWKAQRLDIFEDIWRGKKYYYIVQHACDNNLAITYSIYPKP